jgi:hypothetical protein
MVADALRQRLEQVRLLYHVQVRVGLFAVNSVTTRVFRDVVVFLIRLLYVFLYMVIAKLVSRCINF